MATPTGSSAIFYAVLIAPGFIAVMTAISLAAIEDELSQFVLLVWCLVTSLIIDTGFITIYQWKYGLITSFTQLTSILFQPYFRVDFIGYIFVISIVIGVLGAGAILIDVPGRARWLLQIPASVKYSPRQPWANFMQDTRSIRIKTSDDQLYAGELAEWSRAGRPKEIRISNPYRYSDKIQNYEPVGREDMLFLEKDIDRVLMRERDDHQTLDQRLGIWRAKRGTDE